MKLFKRKAFYFAILLGKLSAMIGFHEELKEEKKLKVEREKIFRIFLRLLNRLKIARSGWSGEWVSLSWGSVGSVSKCGDKKLVRGKTYERSNGRKPGKFKPSQTIIYQ
jgi:hypothetical protein